jgi:hypothetical protein
LSRSKALEFSHPAATAKIRPGNAVEGLEAPSLIKLDPELQNQAKYWQNLAKFGKKCFSAQILAEIVLDNLPVHLISSCF